jgi:hypothetical protein
VLDLSHKQDDSFLRSRKRPSGPKHGLSRISVLCQNEVHTVHFLTFRQSVNETLSSSFEENGDHGLLAKMGRSLSFLNVTP